MVIFSAPFNENFTFEDDFVFELIFKIHFDLTE
jgi:hypothetical protein